MKIKTLILFLFSALVCSAQTNINVVYSFVDGLGNPVTVRQISFTPMTANALGTAIITSNEVFRVATGTSYTNPMISGVAYRVKYFSAPYPPVPILVFTNYFPTTIPANSIVNAVDYMKFGFAWGTSITGSNGTNTGQNVTHGTYTTAATNSGTVTVDVNTTTLDARYDGR